jgi:hypothetical protein
MIRARRLNIEFLDAWLVDQPIAVANRLYRLRLWRENRAALEAIKAELAAYLDEAFEDARNKLRRGFEDALSPFRDAELDPAANYPALLHRVTLQGYLGETLAVIAVEHWGAHGQADWQVPVFLFRFHDQEFQHLEFINERIRSGMEHNPDEVREQRPGRTGDDGLAFRMNENHIITDVLTLEAKCLSENRNAKIDEALTKLAVGGALPSGIRELINLLEDYDTPEAEIWQEALIRLRAETRQRPNRFDGIAYACGSIPVAPRTSWMPTTGARPAYTVNRSLEAMEFQFADLRGLIGILYRDG